MDRLRTGPTCMPLCSLACVVSQQPAQPFTTLYGAFTLCVLADRRKEQHVALALMISLVMIMVHILLEHLPEGAFTKEHEPRHGLLLDRSYPPLRIGTEIRRPRRQWHSLHPSLIDKTLKRRVEFIVSVMDEILPRREEAPLVHSHVPRHLDHPRRMGCGVTVWAYIRCRQALPGAYRSCRGEHWRAQP